MKTKIEEIMKEAHSRVKTCLMEAFPNLYFYISPTGNLNCWVRSQSGGDKEGVSLEPSINAGAILSHEWKKLEEINKEAEKAHTNPIDYFFCTECGKTHPKGKLKAIVMAGYYCEDCCMKDSIKALIKESKKEGFYD